MAVRLVLVDEHPIVLEGLTHVFQPESDFEICGRCTTDEEALLAIRRHRPDVAIIDFHVPLNGAIGLLRQTPQESLPTRIVLFTAWISEEHVVEAVRLGAKGLVLKQMPTETLIQAVRKVHAGGVWLESDVAGRAVDRMRHREAGTKEVSKLLTAREIEILGMVASGLHNREVASRLGIAEGTVKTHVHKIFEKLGVTDRFSLMRYVHEHHLVD